MRSILPEELHGEIPVGFNTAGHVGESSPSSWYNLSKQAHLLKAHLNIRGQYLPYKHIIAQVIMDKNPTIRTVINKVDNVGTESEYRTFSYEVLAGPDDMLVEVSEAGCTFKFDYSKVYWNTKLGTEHQRIVSLFKPGEVVVDVMAGIGPFAAPAGKKGVFVWANDKNPESYKYLTDVIKRNKVSKDSFPLSHPPSFTGLT
jgi:tRNA (guanine37-N1)-methyltransferase